MRIQFDFLLKSTIGVCGVLIGAILNGTGFLFKTRTEERKIINQNIFNLLQAWHIVLTFEKHKPDEFVSLYFNKLKPHLPKELLENKNQVDEFHTLCSQAFHKIIIDMLKNINTDFKDSFFSGLYELSKVSPVMAYDLSKNRNLIDLLDNFEALTQKSYNMCSDSTISNMEGFSTDFNVGAEASKLFIAKDLSTKLQKDIKFLSFKSDIFIWLSCRKKIKEKNQKFKQEKINIFLDKYINGAMKPILEKMKYRCKS